MSSTYTDRLQGLTTSVAVKAPCRVATTANISLSGLPVIDGLQMVTLDRVLVKAQTAQVDNGIWVASPGSWSRALDFDGTRDAVAGTSVLVLAGSTSSGRTYKVAGTSSATINIGSDPIAFDLVNAAVFAAETAAAAYAQSAHDDAAQTNLDRISSTSSASAAAASALDAQRFANSIGRVVKSVSSSVTSSTTLVSDADLSVPIGVNSLMILRGHINYSASAAGDLKWQHAGPTPVSVQVNRQALAPGDTAYSGIAIDTAYSSGDISVAGGAGSGALEFSATIKNGTTAGSFAFKWAQNTSDATATIVKAGSYIEYISLPVSAEFALSADGIAKLGAFPASSSGGHNFVTSTLGDGNSRLETSVYGTKCEAQLFNAGSTPAYTVIVDGGIPSTITAPVGWSFVTLFTGLSDAPHSLSVSGTYYDSDITLRVSGTQPSLTRPSDRPSFYVLGSTPYSTYGALDSLTNLNTNIYPSPYQRSWSVGSGWGLRFKATTTSVRLWLYNKTNPGRVALLQDGVEIAIVSPTGLSNGYDVVTLATGLSGSHEYEAKFIDVGKATIVYALMVDSLDTTTHAAKLIDAHYGDSIAAEVSTTYGNSFDARLGDAYQIADAGGRTSVLRGQGGARVSTGLRDGTATITSMPVLPDRVFITAGTNDMAAGISLATFQADYQTMLSNLRATLSSGQKIYCRGILPRVGYTTGSGATLRNSYNAAISAAVTAMADAGIIYVNTDGWIDPTIGVDSDDGLHPNIAGYAKMATAQLGVL